MFQKIDKSISYPEIRSIMEDDKEISVDLYSIEVKGIDIVVAIGNQNETYIKKDVIYYPIYMIKNTGKAVQIGVYEIKASNQLSMTDENGAIEVEKLSSPLIYVFATKKMLKDDRMLPPGIEEEVPEPTAEPADVEPDEPDKATSTDNYNASQFVLGNSDHSS